MIVSGRHLSRAWLAVLCAASDDEERPALCRAVHIEQYSTGVRLVATDSYWLSHCWVPAAAKLEGELRPTEPDLGELPDASVTVIDDEWRVRDLFKHIAKATKITAKVTPDDIDVELDLTATTYDEAVPTLAPEMAAKRVRIEIADERVLARVWDGEWVGWRTLAHDFASAEHEGARRVAMSGWMFTAMAKAAAICAAPSVVIDWIDPHRGEWSLTETTMDFAPSGLVAANRTAAPPDEDAG